MISLSHKFIDIHIPKTGGTSRWKWYHQNDVQVYPHIPKNFITDHLNIEETLEKTNGDLFKFSFVRNPWDRFVSSYYHSSLDINGFKEQVRKMDDSIMGKKLFLTPQIEWLSVNNINQMDFIGQLESYSKDFRCICETINIPFKALKENVNGEREDYRKYYDDTTAELIGKWFKKDIEEFGYAF